MTWHLIVEGLTASLTFRVVLAAFTAIALHELGHFLAGRLAGIPITHVAIGEGRRLVGWRMGTVTWSIHSMPIGGYVEHVECAGPLQAAAIAAGGPLVSVAAGLSCLALILSGVPDHAGKVLWAMAIAHLATAVVTLFPRQFEDGHKSDGLRIIESFRRASQSDRKDA
jgi:membrane-associated protease RseP (regulator of RpoE activity)